MYLVNGKKYGATGEDAKSTYLDVGVKVNNSIFDNFVDSSTGKSLFSDLTSSTVNIFNGNAYYNTSTTTSTTTNNTTGSESGTETTTSNETATVTETTEDTYVDDVYLVFDSATNTLQGVVQKTAVTDDNNVTSYTYSKVNGVKAIAFYHYIMADNQRVLVEDDTNDYSIDSIYFLVNDTSFSLTMQDAANASCYDEKTSGSVCKGQTWADYIDPSYNKYYLEMDTYTVNVTTNDSTSNTRTTTEVTAYTYYSDEGLQDKNYYDQNITNWVGVKEEVTSSTTDGGNESNATTSGDSTSKSAEDSTETVKDSTVEATESTETTENIVTDTAVTGTEEETSLETTETTDDETLLETLAAALDSSEDGDDDTVNAILSLMEETDKQGEITDGSDNEELNKLEATVTTEYQTESGSEEISPEDSSDNGGESSDTDTSGGSDGGSDGSDGDGDSADSGDSAETPQSEATE